MPSYRLGRFELVGRRELLDAGQPVHIGGRALNLLSVLAEANGRMVTKSELMTMLWQDVTVEENALHVHVAAARKALVDEATRLITIHGRGYRLDAQSVEADVGAAPEQSIAILPFANLSGVAGNDELVSRLSDALVARLVRLDHIRVASSPSSYGGVGLPTDLREVARVLEVTAVLMGSVRASNGRLRVTAQLVDGTTGLYLWAQQFDRELDDRLQAQEELAAEIVSALARRFEAQADSRDATVVVLLTQARALAGRITPVALRRAIDLHERALGIDPGAARAWTGLAGTLMVASQVGAVAADRRADARACAAEAMRLNPNDAAPRAIGAALEAANGRWMAAAHGFESARALAPGEPIALGTEAVQLLAPCGRISAAMARVSQAQRANPGGGNHAVLSAQIAILAGAETTEVEALFDTALLLGVAEERSTTQLVRAEIAQRAGCWPDVANALQYAFRLAPELAPYDPAGLVSEVVDTLSGHVNATSASRRIANFTAAADADDMLWRHGFAAGYLMLWQVQFNALDGAYDVTDRLLAAWRRNGHLASPGLSYLWRAEAAPFRADRRFGRLVSALDLVPYWLAYGPPDGYILSHDELIAV